MSNSERPGRGLIKSGKVLMVLAVALGGLLVLIGFLGAFNFRNSLQRQNGGALTFPTTAGSAYSVWYWSSSNFPAVVVNDPRGREVNLQESEHSGTVQTLGRKWRRIGTFVSETGGDYRFTGTADFAVSPEASLLRTAWPVVIGLYGGFYIGLLGLVLLLVGKRRRSKA
jgi:hypothetical protein